jgi:hypothetical protein
MHPAGGDVALQHPLIGVGCQMVDLGDRVVCPTLCVNLR